MAITSSQVGTTNTLEQFRVQFNNLQTDVSGLEAGTLSYTALSATTISTSELTVTSSFAASSVIFEGDTDDDFETTLSAVDPTGDITVSLPNATTTLVGQDTTDTLTNKTLTTPTLTTPVINAGAQLKNGATSAGFAEFYEDIDNGTKLNDSNINNLLVSEIFKIITENDNKNNALSQLKDQFNTAKQV